LPEVEHDSDQIHQVLLNLLLNAIQAIEKKGYIEVGLERDDDEVSIRVKDNGRGIAPQHLSNIFRPFFTTKGNGTGLGLSLARRIVEEHGGRIEVASSVGHGSKFVVTIPLRKSAADAVRNAAAS
jgi:signal transduction histidine kinase